MGRVLVHGFVLILPFLLYGLYLWQVKRAGKDGPEATPWFWLSVAGLVLMILSFVAYGVMGEHGDGDYVPARWQDGQIVPGDVKR